MSCYELVWQSKWPDMVHSPIQLVFGSWIRAEFKFSYQCLLCASIDTTWIMGLFPNNVVLTLEFSPKLKRQVHLTLKYVVYLDWLVYMKILMPWSIYLRGGRSPTIYHIHFYSSWLKIFLLSERWVIMNLENFSR